LNYSSHHLNESFSHIYVEKSIAGSKSVLTLKNKFPKAKIVEIGHYKDVFNRPSQEYREQKKSLSLILARKEEPYLYKGSQFSDDFGFENFFYTPSMLNCLYDCEYCYLQGMYQSANIVLFTNTEDFFTQLKPYLDKPTLVAISYDTDLLAFDPLNQVSQWLSFASKQENLNIELRTKSANYRPLQKLNPNDRVTLAWTLSPQSIIDRYEHKTPSLQKRLNAIKTLSGAGWRVRICFDPMLDVKNFSSIYEPFVDEVFSELDASRLSECTIGTFRIGNKHLKNIKKMQHSALAFYPYTIQNEMALYPEKRNSYLINSIKDIVLQHMPIEKVRTWQEQ